MSELKLLINKPERPRVKFSEYLANQGFVYSTDENARPSDIDYLKNFRSQTGYKYVEYRKDRNTFMARYWVHGKRIYLGAFKTPREAAWCIHEAIKGILAREITAARRNGEKCNKPSVVLVRRLLRQSRALERMSIKRYNG